MMIAIFLVWALWEVKPRKPQDPLEAAIRKGCDWLERHQGDDGLWSGNGYTTRCTGQTPCAAKELHEAVDPALSALAILALERDATDPAVVRALPGLKQWDDTGEKKANYNKLLAAVAVSRYGSERPEFAPLEFGKTDDCEIGWALDLGLDPEKLLVLLGEYVRGGQVATRSIEAMRALILIKLNRPAKEIKASLDTIATPYPNQRKPDLHTWYWVLRALKAGHDRRFEFWAKDARAHLLLNRKTGLTCHRGSWDRMDQWGAAGGRIYTTAMAVLILRLTRDVPA